MYLTETESGSYLPGRYQDPYGSLSRTSTSTLRRSIPTAPTSIALDDSFDALTTEAPTEWDMGTIRHRDYEESITGYQNYVSEMERKLSGEEAYVPPEPVPAATPLSPRLSHEYARSNAGIGKGRPASHGRRSIDSGMTMAIPENARKVSTRRGKIELFEQAVVEKPDRTISLWRERVAESSAGDSRGSSVVDGGEREEVRSETQSQTHRRVPSSDASLFARRMAGERAGSVVSRDASIPKSPKTPRARKASYERSEYLVAYQQTSQGPMPMYVRSESGSALPLSSLGGTSRKTSYRSLQQQMQMDGAPSHNRRPSYERSEYMFSYPQTPPRSGGSVGSPSSPNMIVSHRRESPVNRRGSIGNESLLSKSGASPIELILASCEPSLLHVAPALTELGIQRMEHLRAIARLSEETRDREVKQQALKRGITVVEWAILLDKLQSL